MHLSEFDRNLIRLSTEIYKVFAIADYELIGLKK